MNADSYAAVWTDLRPRPSADTNQHLRYMVRSFAARFAGRELDGIERHEALSWGMENLSAVRYVRTMISDAIKDGAATRNVLVDLAFPKPPKRRREEHVPSEIQVKALLIEASGLQRTTLTAGDHELAAAIALGAYVGLRWAEILAFRRCDIDTALDKGWVYQQLSRSGALKPIKGKIKERQVNIYRVARPYLARLGGGGNEFVVGATHSDLRQRWEALRETLELRCEFHQLRTFCAVWLLEKGVSPIDVAIQLHGHTDPQVVLGYYAMIDKSKGLARLRRVVDGE